MSRNWWVKFSFLLVSIVMGVMYVYPTFKGLNPETSKFPIKERMNLGLDLQGGLYLVMGIDFNRAFQEIIERQSSSIRSRFQEKSIILKSVGTQREGFPLDDPRIKISFDAAQKSAIYDLLKKEFWSLRLTGETADTYELGLSTDFRNEAREKTVSQSIEVIRNRIDEFGVSEPSITSQGSDRIVVELPGVREVERAKELIGRTAKLEFKLVDAAMNSGQLAGMIAQVEKEKGITYKEGQKFSDYVQAMNDSLKSKLPEGSLIAFERGRNEQTGKEDPNLRVPHLIKSQTEITGDLLQDAAVMFDQQTNRPHVSFTFNARGAVLFEKLTGDNIGKQLAIVLDNIVHSAPVIQSKIGASGQITLGRGNTEQIMKEAKDLAIVLRAGALPAQLDLLEQRVVGPSLGQDSISKGARASIIGAILVFAFIVFYYRFSGIIAAFSLSLNILFVLACLVGLEATLTLPGIAGIGLTVGIAVDSNVVIYERIREEIRAGKSLFASVENGFNKAFHTILDANVTNAIAALVLLNFGSGPIKGFAITLLIGIIVTMFTAVFVCKVLFDLYTKQLAARNAKTISI